MTMTALPSSNFTETRFSGSPNTVSNLRFQAQYASLPTDKDKVTFSGSQTTETAKRGFFSKSHYFRNMMNEPQNSKGIGYRLDGITDHVKIIGTIMAAAAVLSVIPIIGHITLAVLFIPKLITLGYSFAMIAGHVTKLAGLLIEIIGQSTGNPGQPPTVSA